MSPWLGADRPIWWAAKGAGRILGERMSAAGTSTHHWSSSDSIEKVARTDRWVDLPAGPTATLRFEAFRRGPSGGCWSGDAG